MQHIQLLIECSFDDKFVGMYFCKEIKCINSRAALKCKWQCSPLKQNLYIVSQNFIFCIIQVLDKTSRSVKINPICCHKHCPSTNYTNCRLTSKSISILLSKVSKWWITEWQWFLSGIAISTSSLPVYRHRKIASQDLGKNW